MFVKQQTVSLLTPPFLILDAYYLDCHPQAIGTAYPSFDSFLLQQYPDDPTLEEEYVIMCAAASLSVGGADTVRPPTSSVLSIPFDYTDSLSL